MCSQQDKFPIEQLYITNASVRTTDHFPLDIESVQAYGIKKWHRDFFWPIPLEESILMETQVKCVISDLIEENIKNNISDLLLINCKIFMDYNNLLYSLWVLKELEQRNLKPVYGTKSVNFKGIVETGIPSGQALEVSSMLRLNIIKRLRAKAGLIKKQIRLKTPKIYLLSSLYKNNLLFGYVPGLNDLGFEYIKTKLGGRTRLIDNCFWSPGSLTESISNNAKQQIHEITKELTDKIDQIAHRWNIKLTEQQKQYLYDITISVLTKTKICLDALTSNMPNIKRIDLLTGANGNHFSRILCVAIRNNGGTVTTFQHGEPLIYNWYRYGWTELSCADKFFAYTENLAEILKSVNSKYKSLRNNSTEIHGAETNVFYDIWRKESKKPIPGKIKRVMIVPQAFSKDNQVSQSVIFPSLVQLDWELRIINALKKAGCKVLYKKHPHGTLINQSIDFIEDAQIIYEPFEDVMDYADAFLFYHTRSTTFGPALCTNKPIIYIDGGWEKMPEEIRTTFEKRCHVIKAHFDERNRLVFDEKQLTEVLTQKPKEPDLDFAKSYMFPNSLM
jgi:hypothetical protein